ncbi:MAG: pyrroline-5-carboxylate reductase [Opitutales bacterium]|nr:pyrroline-5-carboxylate reductase [Opitutales bacterium]
METDPSFAYRYGFVGAGKMARAMITGLLRSGVAPAKEIICTSAADGTGPALAADTGIAFAETPDEVIAESGVLVLAMKPQQLQEFPDEKGKLAEGRLVLSILAGTPLAVLQRKFPEARNIVRIMPNTPGAIGAGISGWCSRNELAGEDQCRLYGLLQSLGESVAVEEAQMDVLTAVSGSGPAYIFEMAAALIAAGEKEGLSPEISEKLVLYTVFGASRLLLEADSTPEKLRDDVTSPGGTTAAALEQMASGGFRDMMAKTIKAAKDRSRELSKP